MLRANPPLPDFLQLRVMMKGELPLSSCFDGDFYEEQNIRQEGVSLLVSGLLQLIPVPLVLLDFFSIVEARLKIHVEDAGQS